MGSDVKIFLRRMPDETAVHAICMLLREPSIARNVDRPFLEMESLHYILRGIEMGVNRVYGALTEEGELLGCVLGREEEGRFIGHFLFRLHPLADVASVCKEMPGLIKDDYAADGIRIAAVVGQVPDFNLACRKVCLKLGAKDMGYCNAEFDLGNGERVKCREYVLALED